MVSSTSVFVAYLSVTCLLGAQLASAAHGMGLGTSQDTVKGHSGGNLVNLLKTSISSIYGRSAQMLKQELRHTLAVVDGALRGDMGPVKRTAASPGTTSLGSGPLYFLTRELDLHPSATFDDNVEINERLFDIAGK